MAGALRRSDLQAAAQSKLDDAVLLLAHGRYANAYYLSGYAIELGLKACISRQISAETIPDRNLVRDIFQHELRRLVGIAGLTGLFKARQDSDPDFAANWAIVAEWSPEVRYGPVDAGTAEVMLQAVSDNQSGILPWIRQHW